MYIENRIDKSSGKNSVDLDKKLVPSWGPSISAVYEQDFAELIYSEQYVPHDGNAENIYWSMCNFSFKDRGGYGGIQNSGGRLTGKNKYYHNNICSIWDLKETDPHIPTEVTLDYGLEGLHFSLFVGEGTGLHISHYMPWSEDSWYSMVIRRWYKFGEDVTRMAMFMYSYKTNKWTHYMSASIPGADVLFTGREVTGFLERFDGNALGYYGFVRQHFRMGKDGSWQKPKFYTISAGGDSRFWNAELVNENSAIKIIAGGDYNNNKTSIIFNPKQNNNFPYIIKGTKIALKKVEYNSGNVYIDWTVEEDRSPQLSHVINIHTGNENGPIVATNTDAVPEKRSTAFQIDQLTSGQYAASLVITDIFGKQSNCSFKPFNVQ